MEHRCLSPWKGAVAGGLIVFAWNAASRTLLPFHATAVNSGTAGMSEMLTLDALLQMTGAFFWTWILGKIPGLTLKDSALYGCFFGLCVGVLGVMPNWVWRGSPLPVSLFSLADAVIAWTLASLVLSRCYAAACALPEKR